MRAIPIDKVSKRRLRRHNRHVEKLNAITAAYHAGGNVSPQAEVLRMFQAGCTLTVQGAFFYCHTTELRKIVSRLRSMGYPIKSYNKEGESFKRYFLENS